MLVEQKYSIPTNQQRRLKTIMLLLATNYLGNFNRGKMISLHRITLLNGTSS